MDDSSFVSSIIVIGLIGFVASLIRHDIKELNKKVDSLRREIDVTFESVKRKE